MCVHSRQLTCGIAPNGLASGTFFAHLPCDLVRSVVVQTRRRIACALSLFLLFLFSLPSSFISFFFFSRSPSLSLFSYFSFPPVCCFFCVAQWCVFAAIWSPRSSFSSHFFFFLLLSSHLSHPLPVHNPFRHLLPSDFVRSVVVSYLRRRIDCAMSLFFFFSLFFLPYFFSPFLSSPFSFFISSSLSLFFFLPHLFSVFCVV